MTGTVLAATPDGYQNISQQVLHDALTDHGFEVVDARLPPGANLRLKGQQFLWANQFITRRRWRRALKQQVATVRPDVLIGVNEAIPPAVSVAERYGIPSTMFIRSLGVTGLCHYDPRRSIASNFVATTTGGRIQYPLLAGHVRAFGRACREASVSIVNSEHMRQQVELAFDTTATVIYPPINLDAYRVEYDPSGAIGMVNPRKKKKGGWTFLELARSLPNERFLSCGVIGPPTLAAAQADQANWDHIGWHDDMRDFYRLCKAVVVPSERDEAFGRAAAEPMVSGIPVVATDLGGLPEVVGDTGELVPEAASVEQWVGALRRALESHDPQAQCERARRFATERQVMKFVNIMEGLT